MFVGRFLSYFKVGRDAACRRWHIDQQFLKWLRGVFYHEGSVSVTPVVLSSTSHYPSLPLSL